MSNKLLLAVLDCIWNFINDCSENPEKRKDYILDPTCFTRKRILTFKILVGIILSSLKSDIISNMERFFGLDENFTQVTPPTASAFTQQRKKLKFEFFVKLLDVFREAFYKQYATNLKKWKDYVLAAFDGSRISMPDTKEVREKFGEHSHAKRKVKIQDGTNVKEKSPLARASFLFDPLNNIILTAHLVNQEIGEIELAIKDILKLQEEYLFLMDRGYCSFLILYLIMRRGSKFVCRCKYNLIKSAKEFVAKGLEDGYIELKAYHHTVKQLAELGYKVKMDDTISVRAVKITLESGETELLLTNLTSEEASVSELSELYNYRWGEEVAIGIMKNEEQLEIFTGVRVDCIMQDFFATVYLYNYEMLLEKMEEKSIQKINEKHEKNDEKPVEIDHNECWFSTKNSVKNWLLAKDLEASHLEIAKLIPQIIRHRYTKRKGRKFPRTFRVIKLLGKYITLNNYREAG